MYWAIERGLVVFWMFLGARQYKTRISRNGTGIDKLKFYGCLRFGPATILNFLFHYEPLLDKTLFSIKNSDFDINVQAKADKKAVGCCQQPKILVYFIIEKKKLNR